MSVVTTVQEKCKACYACIRNCPVKAIKVEEGQAKILPERCISCGSCVRVCAQKAKQIDSDLPKVEELLQNASETQPVIAILAPSFRVSFVKESPAALVAGLFRLGFSQVKPVTLGVSLTLPLYRELITSTNETVISSYCPAIVGLIENYFPTLIPNLAPIDSAVMALAKSLKYENPQAKIVFIGPCVAKKAEARNEDNGEIVDGVLTFREIKEIFKQKNIELQETGVLGQEWGEKIPDLFPVSGGLLRNLALPGKDFSSELSMVEGKNECLEMLESLTAGKVAPKFVDILFCRGCIDGPEVDSPLDLHARKSLMFTESRLARTCPTLSTGADLNRMYENKELQLPYPSEQEIKNILKYTYKVNPEDELNCSACGYNTCRDKAIAVYQGLAEIDMCLPYLLQAYRGEVEYYKDRLKTLTVTKPSYSIEAVIGKTRSMREIKSLIERAARSETTILIQGESGVGKEVLAQAIHNLSHRNSKPFLGINCAALPELLLESELFGYEEGAFTGARKGGKPGKFELASGGTILLDEIGDMPLNMQAKLLRVLQEREFERVGGTKTIKLNARIIAATNRDLKRLVREGKFRQDLYYRINVIGINVPSLSERKEDILQLCDVILTKLAREKKISPKILARETTPLLTAYQWPGNIRELENVLERAIYVADGNVIRPEHLPAYIQEVNPDNMTTMVRPLREAVRDLEKQLIEEALKVTQNNKQSAAQLLGIPRATLYIRLKEFGLGN